MAIIFWQSHYSGGAIPAMPERAKVFAQSWRAAAMPTFARLFTRETFCTKL
jgi:hypothetical protein